MFGRVNSIPVGIEHRYEGSARMTLVGSGIVVLESSSFKRGWMVFRSCPWTARSDEQGIVLAYWLIGVAASTS